MDWQTRKSQILAQSSVINHLVKSLDDEVIFYKARDNWRAPRAINLLRGINSRIGGKFVENDAAFVRRINKIATGAQPAVVKLVSYGGAKRLSNMLNYISRGGGITIETYTGENLAKNELLTVPQEWEPLLDHREMSRDIGKFIISFDNNLRQGEEREKIIKDILSNSFGDRRFAYRVDVDNDKTHLNGIVVLRSKLSGIRLSADKVAKKIIQQKLTDVFPNQNIAFSFRGYGNGVEYGENRLMRLLQQGNTITDEGVVLKDKDEAKKLINSVWRSELCSRKPRDVMHLMISSRAGTDVKKFTNSVRQFLGATFGEGGHKYIFAIHDPISDIKHADEGGKRPHVHAHAIITTKNIYGERLSIDRNTFKIWRVAMAEAATRNGIEMVMTDRRDTLAAPAYTHKDARPVGYSSGKATIYEGITKSGEKRLEQKILNKIVVPHSNVSTTYFKRVKEAYTNIIKTTNSIERQEFSKKMIQRFEYSQNRNVSKSDLIKEIREGIIKMANTPLTSDSFNNYRHNVDKSLERLHARVTVKDRADFDELAKSANNVIKTREAAINAQDRLNRGRFGDEAVDQGNVIIADIEKQKQKSDVNGDKTNNMRQLDKSYQNAVYVAVRDNNQYLQEYLSRIPETQSMLQERMAKEPQQKQSKTREDRER